MEFSFLSRSENEYMSASTPKNSEKWKNSEIFYKVIIQFFLFFWIFWVDALQFLFSDRPDFLFHNKNSENLSPGVWYGGVVEIYVERSGVAEHFLDWIGSSTEAKTSKAPKVLK